MSTPLKEIPNVRQVPGERRRRWFASPEIDLIIWFNEGDTPVGFQLCYDKNIRERALTLRADGNISHCVVDDGENPTARYKETPILSEAATMDNEYILETFSRVSDSLPRSISDFVLSIIQKLNA